MSARRTRARYWVKTELQNEVYNTVIMSVSSYDARGQLAFALRPKIGHPMGRNPIAVDMISAMRQHILDRRKSE